MRTTLDIDRDILETAKEIARKEKRTAGAVISELARKGFYSAAAVGESGPGYRTHNGVPVLEPSNTLITNGHIDRLRENEGV